MPFQVRFLEDIAIADMAFEVTADSPTELFTAATEAMIESLADPATIGRTWQHEVDRKRQISSHYCSSGSKRWRT